MSEYFKISDLRREFPDMDQFWRMLAIWKSRLGDPDIPKAILAIEPGVTWSGLFDRFAGSEFDRYLLIQVWSRAKNA